MSPLPLTPNTVRKIKNRMDPNQLTNTEQSMTSPAMPFMLGGPSPSPISGRIKSPHLSGGGYRSSANGSQSAFTLVANPPGPMLTPIGRNSSMLMLSPSRTISESLTTLASSTAQHLEEVWDEVGYTPEERASQLSDLLVQFRDLCDAKVAEEKGVAETFRQTISDAKQEIQTTSKALKTYADPGLLKDHSNLSLTDELDSLEVALERLRSIAIAAKNDLIECRDILVESHDALGLELNAKWKDIESDLTASRREEFHGKVVEMKESMATRTSAVIRLLRDCQHLMKDLRINTEENGTDLDRRITGSLVRSKDGSFIMASKFRSDTCTGLSSTTLGDLTSRVAELNGEKRRRKTKLAEMGAKIAALWEKLRIPEEEQRAFTESVQGLGLDTMEKGASELTRLSDLKSQMLGKLVNEAREQIRELWDMTNTTKEQRYDFKPMKIHDEDIFNDDILDQHEAYVRVLEVRLEHMKPIIKIIERREDILRERMEYDELQKDPDRLKQRGAALTKQLMLEEKMARRIKKELPKLTHMLEDKLRSWRKTNGEDFFFQGQVYVNAMKQQDEEWTQYKDDLLHEKRKKKQEEKAAIENRFAPGYGHLPGKKKAASNTQKARGKTSQPLGNAQAKTNMRAPSHA